MTVRCERFVAFRYDPGVCDSCGRLGDQHAPAALETPERTKSLWRTLIRLGGPYDYYGGGGYVNRHEAGRMREHMAVCAPVWRVMREPEMRDEPYFAGTFTDGDYRTTVLGGDLTCTCGQYTRKTIFTPEMTLGQLIWHAVREGDYPADQG